jgi:hypothetical protein
VSSFNILFLWSQPHYFIVKFAVFNVSLNCPLMPQRNFHTHSIAIQLLKNLCSLIIFLHSPLSIAFVLHLYKPVLTISSWTSSNHLFVVYHLSISFRDFFSVAFLVPFRCLLCVWPNLNLDVLIIIAKSRYVQLSPEKLYLDFYCNAYFI